ncbi:MAG: hypothetical protein H6Q19_788 [Bacteroidetes bacterium]|nr:hypothetical protein [Bacteroidota bacterium]
MRKLLFFSLVILLTACNNSGKFYVTGNIADAEKKMLYFEKTGLVKDSLIDSVKLGANGNFRFKSALEEYPGLYKLKLEGQQLVLAVDSTTGKIEIKGKASGLIASEINGSVQSVEIQNLRKSVIKLQQEADGLNAAQNSADSKAVLDTFIQHVSSHKKKVIDLIMKNPRSMSAYFALYQQVSGTYLFSPFDKEDRPFYSAVATAFTTYMPEFDRSKNLYNLVIAAIQNEREGRLQKAWQELQNTSAAGFIDIELNDAKGVARKLSSLTGKTVIIDFSAFESENNVAYTFELRDIYNKYSSQGLEIYQISLDRNAMLWQKSVANLPWICVRDADGSVANMYNVQSIPTLYLINKQGTIIGRYGDVRQLAADISKVL